MKKLLLLFFVLSISISYGQKNYYTDPFVREIYELKEKQNSSEIFQKTKSVTSSRKALGVKILGQIADTLLIDSLSIFAKDPNETVRNSLAFALGQFKNQKTENLISDLIQSEKSVTVKKTLLEALGKSGSKNGLTKLLEMNFPHEDLKEGQVWGFYRFMNRGLNDPAVLEKVFITFEESGGQSLKYACSSYLARSKNLNSTQLPRLLKLFRSNKNIFTQANLIQALGKINDPSSLNALKQKWNPEEDIRIKVSVLRALQNFHYDSVSPVMIRALEDPSPQITVVASEYFYSKGKKDYWFDYFKEGSKAKSRVVKANMYAATIRYSEGLYKSRILREIEKLMLATSDNYLKALLIKALAEDPDEFSFISRLTFPVSSKVVSSNGMEAIIKILGSKDSVQAVSNDQKEQILKSAFLSGDAGVICIAADALNDPSFNFPEISTYYLDSAWNSISIPADIETCIALSKLYEKNGIKKECRKQFIYPDWTLLLDLDQHQKVIVKTSKGEFVMELFVNQAPSTVSNFIRHLNSGLYNNNKFHRVVPSFVAQGGCPRGDGWGGTSNLIRSEFQEFGYNEGYVGMASAGKDTESCQWFITHLPTPHLNGNYSIFGRVIKGMSVVQELEVGDIMESVTLQ